MEANVNSRVGSTQLFGWDRLDLWIVAAATDPDGNTLEFSAGVLMQNTVDAGAWPLY